MSELENNLIEKVKILILYGNRPVDGEDKDGKVERIFRDCVLCASFLLGSVGHALAQNCAF